MMLVALQSLVSNGMASILARALGGGDRDAARRTFAAAHALAIAVVLVVNAIYWTVGWRIVEYPGSETRVTSHTESIRTIMTPNTGLINTCWLT